MLESLREFAVTDKQREVLDAVIQHGSHRKAALALNMNHSTVDDHINKLKQHAAVNLISAHSSPTKVPAGYAIKGTTTLRKEGVEVMQWVKTDRDAAASQQILIDFANSLGEQVKGLAPIVCQPGSTDEDLLCVYPLSDPHFGLRAWVEDTGSNFLLEDAERLTCGAIDRLVETAPAATTGLLLCLGDLFHANDESNSTQSGHVLDVDGRWAKVQQVGLKSMIHCIQRMLEKHEKVIFRINRGNHDRNSSYALALMMSCYFHEQKRVHIDMSPAAYWYYQFGKVLIGSSHGDTIKGPAMVGLMAADRPEAWGETKHRYWMVGHIHHQDSKEYPGGIVEYFRTLCARDAWHAGQDYRAGRDMRLIVMHKEHGEIERHRCDIGMLH